MISRLARIPLALGLFALTAEAGARAVTWYPALRTPLLGTPGPLPEVSWAEWHARSTVSPYQHDPALGWRMAPGVRREPHGSVTVDGRGFRAAPPRPSGAPEPTLRVVALGDSYTFGDEVADGEPWVHRLEQAHPALTVDNLGVVAHGLDQTWLTWQRHAPDDPADVVLLTVLPVMSWRTLMDWEVFRKPTVPAETGDLRPVGVPVPDAGTVWRQIVWRPRLPWLARTVLAPPARDAALASARTVALLDAWVADVARTGARPIVVRTFAAWDVDRRHRDPLFDTVEAWCADAAITCLDAATPLLEAHARGVPIRRGAHWTPEANGLVAEIVAGGLEASGVLPERGAPTRAR